MVLANICAAVFNSRHKPKKIISNRPKTVTRNCLSRANDLFLAIKPERGKLEIEIGEPANEAD
jgi:hypothetical protein